jgi:amidophosphoribosyltransferase
MATDWDEVVAELDDALGVDASHVVGPEHALVTVRADAETAQAFVAASLPALAVASAGTSIEIYKDAIRPDLFVERFALDAIAGTHALGHTRMATESRVTTAGSHPFSTGMDLCLVHNGSLSNHNRLRQQLRQEGMTFQTENDTEVAAGYLAWRLREGATLEQALEGCLEDLDGFYTFAVGTRDGFAVLRDPIACKPAIMAETDDWVAMASEYRALAVLPGAEDARLWEPEPATVYSWGAAPVPA